jgi:glycosyltransferase involved in cell wall biosynthesis
MIQTKPLHLCFFGTYDKTFTSNLLTLQGFKQNNIQVTEVNAHIKVTALNKKNEMGWWPLVKRVFKKYRILVVIFQNLSVFKEVDAIYVGYPGHFDVLFAVIIGKIFRKKVVFNPLLIFYTGFVEEQRILNKDAWLAKLIKWGESFIYNSVDLVIADTPFQEDYLIRDFQVKPEKIKCVPIGADDAVYAYTPFTNTQGKKLHVVYYGLYSPIHGVEYIIEAAKLLKNNPDIHFTMVGNGQTFQKNYDLAQELKLSNITFHYNLPESEHIAILQTADVFLGFLPKHPTVDRVIPNKVYQGLSLGKVVLTADAPVTRSVFSHKENMYLVEPSSATALTEALLELSQQPELRTKIAKAGHGLYVSKFNSKAVGGLLIKHIAEIVNT